MRSLAVAAALLLTTSVASAADTFVECPPGSTKKEEGTYSWCQPTVCENDTQCTPNVCRSAGLCMQVGSLNKPGEPDGGARLIATQICQEDKQCPTQQTCSVMKRCVTQAQADKMAANTPATTTEAPKKSSCGCSVIGAKDDRENGFSPSTYGFAGFALSGLLVLARRRGARRKSQ
jgi:hypothetical protein